jgi:hypothetical protein
MVTGPVAPPKSTAMTGEGSTMVRVGADLPFSSLSVSSCGSGALETIDNVERRDRVW